MLLFVPLTSVMFAGFTLLSLSFGLRVLAALYSAVYFFGKASLLVFVAMAAVGFVMQCLLLSPVPSLVVSVCLFPVSALETTNWCRLCQSSAEL